MHDLAARLARGDETAFVELYDACADRLHRYLAVRLGSRDTASDVLQSVFLRAVTSRRRFRGVDNPVAYLFQIARNEAARITKKPVQTLPADTQIEASGDACEQSEYAEVVAAALKRLDAKDQELVELKTFGGLTFREIAELTGLPQGTVATRYRRALESLRPWLSKQLH